MSYPVSNLCDWCPVSLFCVTNTRLALRGCEECGALMFIHFRFPGTRRLALYPVEDYGQAFSNAAAACAGLPFTAMERIVCCSPDFAHVCKECSDTHFSVRRRDDED